MSHYIGQVSEHAVIVNGEGKILLLVHKGPGSDLKGKSHLPGGRMEFDDKPGSGLLREIEEETGITGVELILPCSASRWGAVEPIKYSVAYLARVAGAPVPVLPSHEDHESAAWVTPEEALTRTFIFPGMSAVVAEVIRWGRILGVIS
jgi:8-oxo-dGTP pyrophosphatase MutT (NUDIX family)